MAQIDLPYPPSSKTWTEEEDNILRAMYLTHERAEIGTVLGRTKGSIRSRCSALGLNYKSPAVTGYDLARIRHWYEEHALVASDDFKLDDLAQQLGRTKNFISRLASRMELTKKNRQRSERLKSTVGNATREYIKREGHPKGMLGKNHTDEFKAGQSERVKARVFTPEQIASMVDKMMKTRIDRYGTGNPGLLTSSNPYSRTKSGKREDLDNRFFRSSWEANYARYLNWLIAQGELARWEFECQTFVFHGVTRGVISYTPDFKVYSKDGSYEWHEVKGWMDAKSKAKLKRMAKFYPDEKIVLIDAKAYRSIAKWKGMIPNWE